MTSSIGKTKTIRKIAGANSLQSRLGNFILFLGCTHREQPQRSETRRNNPVDSFKDLAGFKRHESWKFPYVVQIERIRRAGLRFNTDERLVRGQRRVDDGKVVFF